MFTSKCCFLLVRILDGTFSRHVIIMCFFRSASLLLPKSQVLYCSVLLVVKWAKVLIFQMIWEGKIFSDVKLFSLCVQFVIVFCFRSLFNCFAVVISIFMCTCFVFPYTLNYVVVITRRWVQCEKYFPSFSYFAT